MHLLNAGLDSGSVPPAFTANAMSLPILENVLAILSHLAILEAFLYSNALPILIFKFPTKLLKSPQKKNTSNQIGGIHYLEKLIIFSF
jgi:hypothetical protein